MDYPLSEASMVHGIMGLKAYMLNLFYENVFCSEFDQEEVKRLYLLACKKKGLTSRVFSIVGDGECDEGLIWEAAMSAANYGLNNFVLIVDRNKLQYDGPTAEVMNQIDLGDKFRAFGFDVRVVDGHDVYALAKALNAPSDKPVCVIADTIKGKGVSFMEGVKTWHHSVLTQEQYDQAVKEVENV